MTARDEILAKARILAFKLWTEGQKEDFKDNIRINDASAWLDDAETVLNLTALATTPPTDQSAEITCLRERLDVAMAALASIMRFRTSSVESNDAHSEVGRALVGVGHLRTLAINALEMLGYFPPEESK